jgi:two-component system response regulator FixJ
MTVSTVFIIDDDSELLTSLNYLLKTVGLIVKTYNNPQDYLAIHNNQDYGCLLVDIRMPSMSGLELQKQLVALHNPLPLILMTGHGDINMAVHAMKQGAFDFITKPFNDQALLDLIQKAIAKDLKRRTHKDHFFYAERFATLTKREREVMQKVVEGKLNKVTAYELGISNKTVELHRANVMKKMQIKSVVELVKICTQFGNLMPISED